MKIGFGEAECLYVCKWRSGILKNQETETNVNITTLSYMANYRMVLLISLFGLSFELVTISVMSYVVSAI